MAVYFNLHYITTRKTQIFTSVDFKTLVSQNTIRFPHSYGTALWMYTLTISSHLCLCLPNILLPYCFYDNFTCITTHVVHATCPIFQPASFTYCNRLAQCGPYWTQWCTCSVQKSRGIPLPNLMSGDRSQLIYILAPSVMYLRHRTVQTSRVSNVMFGTTNSRQIYLPSLLQLSVITTTLQHERSAFRFPAE